MVQRPAPVRQFFIILSFLFSFIPIMVGRSFNIVSTTSVFHDMVQVIGGNMVESFSLTPVSESFVVFKDSAEIIQLIQDAKLIISNGLQYESGLKEAIERVGAQDKTFRLAEGIPALPYLSFPEKLNPYAWLDPQNGMVYARQIKEKLILADPERAENYQFNYQLYVYQLTELDTFVRNQIQLIPESQRVLPLQLEAFRYFASRYGIQFVKTKQEEQFSFQDSLFTDALSTQDGPADTYLNMIRHNTRVLIGAMKKMDWQPIEDTAPSSQKVVGKIVLFFSIVLIVVITATIFFKRKSH